MYQPIGDKVVSGTAVSTGECVTGRYTAAFEPNGTRHSFVKQYDECGNLVGQYEIEDDSIVIEE